MISGVWYYVLITARRQAVLAPIVTLFAIVGIVYATDAGPPLAAATVPAAFLVPIGAWIIRLVATAESKPFADVTLVALGSGARRHVCRGAAALIFGLGLSTVATVWARIANTHHDYASGVVLTMVVMNVVLVIAGIGLGSLLSPPLRVTAGAGALAATIIALVSLVIRFVPPIGPVLDAYIARRTSGPIALVEATTVGAVAFLVAGVLGRRDR